MRRVEFGGDSMVDIHCHLLPGVDDGSKSVEQSVRVLNTMANGVAAVCLTPHLSLSELAPPLLSERLAMHDAAYEELMLVAPARPKCHRGVELMIDGSIPPDALIDSRITLGGSRYLLIEFPRELSALAIRALIAEVARRDIVPIIAHVERYGAATPEEVFLWRECGAAIQVDATTLARETSRRADRARAIVEAGLADVLAADNHGDERSLLDVRHYLRQVGAEVQGDYLLRGNPSAVLNDQALEPVPPIHLVRNRWRRIRRFFFQPS